MVLPHLSRVCFVFAACCGAHLLATPTVRADELDRFERRTYKDADGLPLQYRLLRPQPYDADKSYPLVLFLHGAGERGDDNNKQLVHGMRDFASDDVMKKHPCFVVAPQCPNNVQWVDAPWSADSHQQPEQPTAPMKLAIELVGALSQEFSIDKKRLYVTGLSMGGFGTWDAIQRQPEMFAAAIPICGGGDMSVEKVKPIAKIPIWAFHGDKDTAVKTQRSRDMIAALKSVGGTPKYTQYAGVGHNSWAATYSNRDVYDWLFAQSQ